MIKTRCLGAVFIGLFSLGILCSPPAAAKEPYKIGAVFSITGPASFLGEPEQNTAKMVADTINQKGGINGHPLELVIYDDEGAESKAVLAVKKLIQKDNVLAIIGPSTSGSSMAAIPIVNELGVPLISCAASKKIAVPVEERKWVFKVVAGDDLAVQLMYDHMKSKGIKKIGLMTVSTAYGISGRTEMQRLAPLNGIQIVADETYGPKDSDLSAQFTKIRGTEAQAIVNWSIGPTQIIATMNWKNLGLKTPLYQSYGFGSKKNIELARGTAEGVLLPVPRVVIADKLSDKDPQKATVTLYNQMFESKFKQEVSVFGGHAWDALFQTIQALKEVGPDKEKIRNYLENLRGFIGQNGIFNRSAKDHEGLTKEAYVMVEVKNGDWDIVK